jgi:hypothetical protein
MADRRERIYYPIGSINSGLYTNGGELMEKDGTPYVGQYHTYKNTKEIFSEPNYVKNLSRRLIPFADLGGSADVKRVFQYNTLKEIEADDYSSIIDIPDPYYPILTNKDKIKGVITRYFMKHKGNETIFEVDKDGFGFDSVYYDKLELQWKIVGPLQDVGIEKGVIDTNRRTLALHKNNFIGIDRYLLDLKEFYFSPR